MKSIVAFVFFGLALCQLQNNLAFSPVGDRSVIFSNNPEQLLATDVADSDNNGGIAIVQVESIKGKYRNFWEHLNSAAPVIGWGIVAVNTNKQPVNVTVTGQGATDDIYGGKPFVQAWNQPVDIQYIVPPMGYAWIYQNNKAAYNGTIFSGVVDFEVTGGILTVLNLCYIDPSNVNPETLTYDGYQIRMDPGKDDEARVYKGLMTKAEVSTFPLHFHVGDYMPNGTILPVVYSTYNLSTQNYNSPREQDSWISNLTPFADSQAIVSDMLAIYMPSWGYVDPLVCCDGRDLHPNLGNWAVVYTMQGKVTNYGAKNRILHLSMTNPFACIAFQSNSSSPWAATLVENNVFNYGIQQIPAQSTTSFSFKYIVGGPADGGEVHQFWVQ